MSDQLPVIIEVALNGVTTRERNPHVPSTPDEIAALATQLAPQVRAALTSQLPIDSTLDHRDLEQRVECSERDLKVTEERDVSP